MTQVNWDCVAEVSTAMSGSAELSATIDDTTVETARHATTSNQTRARAVMAPSPSSMFWSGVTMVSTTGHLLEDAYFRD